MFVDNSKCSLCSNSASASLYRDDAVASGIHIYIFYVYVSKPVGICSVCGVSSSSEPESPPAEQKHILVLKMYSRRSRSNSSQTINHAEPSSQPPYQGILQEGSTKTMITWLFTLVQLGRLLGYMESKFWNGWRVAESAVGWMSWSKSYEIFITNCCKCQTLIYGVNDGVK